MGKKPKPETPNSPPSNNIFKSLFGNEIEQPNNSIFSDSNPFKSKSQNLQKLLQLDIDSPPTTHIPDSPKSRKRKQKSPEPIELNVKKPKSETGFVSKTQKDSNFNEEKKKKKKKRKRSEVEEEYEEKKYGGVDLEVKEDEGVKLKVGEKRKELDKGEELMVEKEGFDDDEKLLRTVFVGNLPLKVKKKALLKEFSQFGEIESVRIRSIPLLDDKTPRKGAIIKKKINEAVDRVNAYIVFKTEDSAQASLAHNMAVVSFYFESSIFVFLTFYPKIMTSERFGTTQAYDNLLVGGNHIHVDRACPPRKKLKGESSPLYDPKRTVFIGNLPFDVKDEELYQLFTSFNNLKDSIEAIRVVRDPGTSMGKGIAYVLFKTREAANMVVKKHKLKIRDRELRLSHALKSTGTPSKQKESSSYAKNSSSFKSASAGGNTSYQGLRATKSGGQKKFSSKVMKHGRMESTSESGPKRKVRSEKRPTVAARKAAANAAKTGGGVGGSGSGGKKRKPESRTPQSNTRNKKPRKFR